jgi:hypothetical protein
MIRSRLRASLLLLLVTCVSACGGSNHGSPLTAAPPPAAAVTLSSLTITPDAGSGAAGTLTQLTATGTFSDGSKSDISSQVSWASSSTAVANVNSQGMLSAFAQGNVTVSAALSGKSASTTFSVTAPVLVGIEITPPVPNLANGRTLQLVATGVFSDNTTQNLTTQVTWSSSTAAVASIGSSSGIASASGVGTTTIGATSGSVSGSLVLTVTAAQLQAIQVTPSTPSIAKGLSQQFTATGIFSDNSTQNLTTQVTWKSSSTSIASVSASSGIATGTGLGSTAISATIGTISGNTSVTVTPAVVTSIQVTPTTPSYANGLSAQLTATAIFSDNSTQDLTTQVVWTSTNTAAATVSNSAGTQGALQTVGVGTATLTAAFNAISGSTLVTVTPAQLVSIQVTPPSPSIAKGLTQQFTATGIYTDNTTQNLSTTVLWSSSNTAASTISNAAGSQGAAFAATVGSTTITATTGTVSGNTPFVVTPAVVVSIEVTPASPSVAKGLPQQFIATGTYTDNSVQDVTAMSTWASSSGGVATISNASGSQGLASTHAIGTTTVSSAIGAISGSTVLTVTPAVLVSIQIGPGNPAVALGLTQQFTATGVYTDSSTQNLTTMVTWMSDTPAVATISNAAGSNGLATTATTGTSLITATLGAISGTTTLNVTAAALVSIAVTPTNPSIAKGRTQQFTAIGTFTDHSTQTLTGSATWFSATLSVASISNAAGSQGRAFGAGTGTSAITAVSAGITSNTATLTVTPAVLASLAVTPTGADIAINTTQQFTAIGTFSDSTTQNLTTTVTWASSNTAAISISNVSGLRGLATALGTSDGTSTITASSGAIVSPGVSAATHVSWNSSGASSIFQIISCGNGGSGCHSSSSNGINQWVYVPGDPDTTYSEAFGVRFNLSVEPCDGSDGPPPIPPDMPPAGAPGGFNTPLSSAQCALLAQWVADGAPNN